MTSKTLQLLITLLCAGISFPLLAQVPDTIYFCSGNSNQVSSAPAGVAYDRFGENANYNNFEFCTLLLQPDCATSLTLNIDYISSEGCCDLLYIYDGDSDLTGTFIGSYSGAQTEIQLTANSGKMYIRWQTDWSGTSEGFKLRWSAQVTPVIAPVASLTVSDMYPALNEWISFEANATNSPLQWTWDFGDGQTSNLQHPQHRYSTPGAYTATLVVSNCHQLKDTVYQNITVQEAPQMSVTPASLSLTTSCEISATSTIQLVNEGDGDLLFQAEGRWAGKKKVVVFSYSASLNSMEGIHNILSSYNQDVVLSQTSTLDSATLAMVLKDQDILIFPELTTNFFVAQIAGLRGAIQNFMDQGGSVIICGALFYNSVHAAYDFLTVSSIYSTDVSGQWVTFAEGHPITDGLPVQITAPYFAGVHTFNALGYVSLCDVAGGSLLGYSPYGRGNIVYAGFNFQNPDLTLKNLLFNTVNWCDKRSNIAVTPANGMISPGDTLELQISIPTEELFAGIYEGSIHITSNENAPNTADIPFTLNITGQASLSLTPAVMNFDTVIQFGNRSRIVAFSNPGCDSLQIDSVSTNVGGINWGWSTPVVIPPYSTDTLEVTFSPQDTGSYGGYIAFATNIGVFQLEVSGYVSGAPFAVFVPDSLSVSLSCGDSMDVQVQVVNTGQGTLFLERQESNTQPRILILDYFSYYYIAGFKIQNWLQFVYPGASFGHIDNTMGESAIRAEFDAADLVILPALYSLNDLAPSPYIREIFRAYLERGGSVIVSGSPYLSNLDLPELLSATPNYSSLFIPQLVTEYPEHPLLDNVMLSGNTYDNIWGVQITSPDYVPLVSHQGYDVVGYRQNGFGKIVYIGHKFEYEEEQPLRLLLAAVKWTLPPQWLGVMPEEAVIAPGDTTTLTIHFSAAGLTAGELQWPIRFRTDHPQIPVVTFPVELQVTGTPQLNVPNLAYNFGVIQQFTQHILPVSIENTGCDSLHLNNLHFSNPAFSALNPPLAIPPFSSRDISIRFGSDAAGLLTGTLTVDTDGGSAVIQLTGLAIGAPVVTISPQHLRDTLRCDQVHFNKVTIENTGLGTLSYQIGPSQESPQLAILLFGANLNRFYYADYYLQQVFGTSARHFIQTAQPEAFADSLAQSDILIVPPLSSNAPSAYAALAAPIQQFLNRGGIVLIAGIENKTPLVQMGLISGTLTFNELYYPALRKNTPQHTITQNLPDTPLNVDYQHFSANFDNNSGYQTLLTNVSDNKPYLAFRPSDNGLIVWWGHGFSSYSPYTAEIWSGLREWFNNPLPSGVSTNAVPNGFIPAGANEEVQLIFNGDQIPGGDYSGSLKLRTNDPLRPFVSVPLTLTASNLPCTSFSYTLLECSGQVTFSDTSVNPLTTYYWEFGDGAQSFLSNPTHIYSNAGVYTVALVACNNFGCDTTIEYIQIPPFNEPKDPICEPHSSGQCCDSGISRVKLGNLDYFSPSGAAEADYIDRSCNYGTELQAGTQYAIEVKTSSNAFQYVKVWIDFNNNGDFTLNEQVLSSYNLPGHYGFVTAPVTAEKDIPLRMRVMADLNNYPEPCLNLSYGQTEDYYVILRTGPVGVEDAASNETYRIFPNPTSGTSLLDLGASGTPKSVTIMNQAGIAFYRQDDVVTPDLELPTQVPGVYLVHIQSGERAVVKKWVVVR